SPPRKTSWASTSRRACPPAWSRAVGNVRGHRGPWGTAPCRAEARLRPRRPRMLSTAGELKGVTIHATDGDIGGVHDLYFDDTSWTVRYLVVDTGTWLPGRRVLISPFAFRAVPGAARLRTTLTKEQIENSPSIDTDRPVNRQREIEYSGYYGYPYYWIGPYRWGDLAYPGMPIPASQPSRVEEEMLARERLSVNPNLRSARDVMGYYIQATDGDLGHVEDFLVHEAPGAIGY